MKVRQRFNLVPVQYSTRTSTLVLVPVLCYNIEEFLERYRGCSGTGTDIITLWGKRGIYRVNVSIDDLFILYAD